MQLELFSSSPMPLACVYCGGQSETRDHVPSKVLLDEPLPENLQTVDACLKCNQSFSQHEEYLACFLEAVLVGSAKPESGMRLKVWKSLTHSPSLATRIENSSVVDRDNLNWMPEHWRVEKVIWKLAQGHAAQGLSMPRLGVPDHLTLDPLVSMSDFQLTEFERTSEPLLWPEVGSRALIRAVKSWSVPRAHWRIVQPGRYRYALPLGPGIKVKIVLSEYLACEVQWAGRPKRSRRRR